MDLCAPHIWQQAATTTAFKITNPKCRSLRGFKQVNHDQVEILLRFSAGWLKYFTPAKLHATSVARLSKDLKFFNLRAHFPPFCVASKTKVHQKT